VITGHPTSHQYASPDPAKLSSPTFWNLVHEFSSFVRKVGDRGAAIPDKALRPSTPALGRSGQSPADGQARVSAVIGGQ
jgi:hypothetical protein